MNLSTKARWANILTALVAILTMFQTYLTSPPFSQEWVFNAGAWVTFIVISATGLKQYLSPDVSDAGTKFTLWSLAVALLAGLADLINIFPFTDETDQKIRLGITILIMAINILSKQLFPSEMQKEKMFELKTRS